MVGAGQVMGDGHDGDVDARGHSRGRSNAHTGMTLALADEVARIPPLAGGSSSIG